MCTSLKQTLEIPNCSYFPNQKIPPPPALTPARLDGIFLTLLHSSVMQRWSSMASGLVPPFKLLGANSDVLSFQTQHVQPNIVIL